MLFSSLQLFLDDVLLYKGSLVASPDKSNCNSRRSASDCEGGGANDEYGALQWRNELGQLDLSQSILFTNDPKIVGVEVLFTTVCYMWRIV